MFIAADDNRRIAGESSGKELVVIRIIAYFRMKSQRKSKVGFQGDHFKKIGNVDMRKLSTYVLNNPPVFRKNVMTDYNFNLSTFPNLNNPIGWTFEKYSGNQHVGIKNYFNLSFLTLLMALVISDSFNPALRACFRASLSNFSNSSKDGGEIVLKITESPLPITTNWTPVFNPRESLISSGITTCPFDDSRVVARFVLMEYSLPVHVLPVRI